MKQSNVLIISDILTETAPQTVIENFENNVRESFPFLSDHQFDFFHRKIHNDLGKIKMPTMAFFLGTEISIDKSDKLAISVSPIKAQKINEIIELENEIKRLHPQEEESFESHEEIPCQLNDKEKFENKWATKLFGDK